MISRHLEPVLREALADRPVVLLRGARQVGKSTLARAIAESERPPRRYITFDDATVLAAVQADPEGFVSVRISGRADGDLDPLAPLPR